MTQSESKLVISSIKLVPITGCTCELNQITLLSSPDTYPNPKFTISCCDGWEVGLAAVAYVAVAATVATSGPSAEEVFGAAAARQALRDSWLVCCTAWTRGLNMCSTSSSLN